jgi:isoleucyl-tRNA synthetase
MGLPGDLYLEGSDQHRGWFQSSLLVSVGSRGHAPYREVLTHGFVVDGEGRKMSKSVGNTVKPEKLIQQMGAELVRLWAAAADYRDDVASRSPSSGISPRDTGRSATRSVTR